MDGVGGGLVEAKLGFHVALLPKFVRKGENDTEGPIAEGIEEVGEDDSGSGTVAAEGEGG